MEEIIKENNKKSNAAIIALAIIFILILLGVVFWFIFQFLMPSIGSKPLPQTLISQTYCQQDNDCALVQKYEDCCGTCGREAVRKDMQATFEKSRLELCVVPRQCPAYKCPPVDYKAVCEQNKCATKITPVVSNNDLLVTLDKWEYLKGEKVKINIQNYKDVDMAIYNIAVEHCAIEPGQVGECLWEIADNDIQCPCSAKCEKAATIITSKGVKNIIWDQYTNKIDLELFGEAMVCKMADAGAYRFKIDYYGGARAGADQQLQTIYSSDFQTTEEASSLNTNTSATSLNQYKIIGSFTSSGGSSFIEKIGNTVFMTDISEGLLAIDVSNSVQPKLISKTKIDGGGAYALAKSQDNSYLMVSGYGNTKMALIDLVNSDKPNMVTTSIDTKRSVQDMVLAGDYAYLAIDGPEVEILKVEREASSPYLVKGLTSKGTFQIQGGGHAIGVAVSESISEFNLAVAQGESGAAVYDFITPSAPKFKVGIHPVGFGSTVAVQGNFGYVGVGGEVKIAGISSQNLTEMGSVQAGSAWDIKVKDNMLYVASGEEGVKIFDVSDVNNPKQIAVIDTPGRARDLAIDGDYIYVADDRDDLQIIKKE